MRQYFRDSQDNTSLLATGTLKARECDFVTVLYVLSLLDDTKPHVGDTRRFNEARPLKLNGCVAEVVE